MKHDKQHYSTEKNVFNTSRFLLFPAGKSMFKTRKKKSDYPFKNKEKELYSVLTLLWGIHFKPTFHSTVLKVIALFIANLSLKKLTYLPKVYLGILMYKKGLFSYTFLAMTMKNILFLGGK